VCYYILHQEMGFFRTTIYGIIFGVYSYTLFYDVKYLPRFGATWWISKLVMLTVLNFVLQFVYSTVCLICAVLDWKCERNAKKLSKPQKQAASYYWRKSSWHEVCDFMYYTSAFPVGMATCLLFWVLYTANPESVMPTFVGKVIPPWYNHVTHTAPIGFLLIDTLLTCHRAPSRSTGSAVVIALFICYAVVIFAVKYAHGYWLYPVFDLLQFEYQILLVLAGGVLFWFLFIFADGLNAMLWGEASHGKQGLKRN